MRCPFCSAVEDKVVDTRPSDNEQVIRRRRECTGCSRRFTTYERVDEILPMVIKKDGRREPFDRKKILEGLTRACQKRPVSASQIEALISAVERQVQELGEKEIPSRVVGEAVMKRLRDLDPVAFVRFASVYRAFEDVGDFMSELEGLAGRKGEGPR
jgi:transcriptional repressor NrdR